MGFENFEKKEKLKIVWKGNQGRRQVLKGNQNVCERMVEHFFKMKRFKTIVNKCQEM